MRLIDADELMEHVWRDKLDSRELIAEMIDNAPTVKKISTEIPINIFEQLILQQPKTGHWIVGRIFPTKVGGENLIEYRCSKCDRAIRCTESQLVNYPYCHCGMKMVEPQESEDKDADSN